MAASPVATVEQAGNHRGTFSARHPGHCHAGGLSPDSLPYELPVVTFSISRSVSSMANLHDQLVKPVSRQA